MTYARNQINSGAGYGVSLQADAAIAAGLLVKGGVADGTLAVATATSEDLIGVTISAATAAGDDVSVAIAGDIVQTKAGGTVTRGTLQMFVTGGKITDVSGNVRVIGMALASGVDGDLIPVLVAPGRVGTA